MSAVIVAAGLVVAPANAEPAGFSSSFEAGEPQPTWVDTVETDPSGQPKTAGVNGANGSAIPGDIRGKVTEVTASDENTSAGEVAANLIDGKPESKWLAFSPDPRLPGRPPRPLHPLPPEHHRHPRRSRASRRWRVTVGR